MRSTRCAGDVRLGMRLGALLLGTAVALGPVSSFGAPGPDRSERRRPFEKLAAPPIRDVKVDDDFWAPRIRMCREVTLPHCYEMSRTTGRIANFRRAAGDEPGPFEGAHFNDSDVYKIVEGSAWALATQPDSRLRQLVDETIAAIAAAQDRDGYLDTFFTIDRQDERFRHIFPNARHELYCMGHAIEAGATHYELTGKREFLDVARRLADHIDSVFGPERRRDVPEHQELELALIKLFRVTGEKRYLELARFFIDERGNSKGHKLYGEYSQDHLPIRGQSEIVGHAVRAMYNCLGAADLYREIGDPRLLAALGRLWESTTGRKMYVTGGVGATRRGEAFSPDYHLPNATAYAETCAQIGLVLFAHRMLLLDPDARYADVLERTLYNGFLSGISLSGDRFFYQNRLSSRGDYRRQPWYSCACCPSNVVRLLPRVGEFVYAQGGDPASDPVVRGDAIYVNLYVAGTGIFTVGPHRVTIRQETRYPWDGRVELSVLPAKAQEFTLYLRIPGWCRDEATPDELYRWDRAGAPPGPTEPVLTINDKPVRLVDLAKGYARVRRQWSAGDRVKLDLPMPILRIRAHRAVRANRGRVALQRGPLVYCLEAEDHEASIQSLILPRTTELAAHDRPDLLGGVTVITGPGQQKLDDGSLEDTDLLAIPYYAWDNRQSGEMAVWLAENPQEVGPWKTSTWVGSNYTPAYCVNQIQMWHEFREEVVERELAAARRHLGITTLRVYLHNIPYDAERERFLGNLERFLVICDRHGIRPGFTFFDDCHRHEGITLESLPPVKGWHNGRWAACPQDRERTDEDLPKFKAYVQDVVRAHAKDPRVLWWEIFNEPNMQSEFSVKLRKLGYAWALAVEPRQPVISCWDDNAETDIVDAHNYRADFDAWDRQAELNPDKGAVFTEAGARWYAPRPSNGEPCEVLHWLTTRKAAREYVPGVYLCWELMVGNSNCRWYWGTAPNTPEPTIPWCGLLWADGTPVSLAEAEAIRRYTRGAGRALFFDDFEPAARAPQRPGWTAFGRRRAVGSGVLKLDPGMKMITGDPAWSDYVVEARVLLQGEEGNAGLVLRVNEPGDGHDEMLGYYVGFDTKTLYLGKMNNAWSELATFDLADLECSVVPGVWNLLRVAVEGPRLRVWFNRMHHDGGLRLDCTDQQIPVLRGRVGVRTHRVGAWFDNIVVLPIDALPTSQDDSG